LPWYEPTTALEPDPAPEPVVAPDPDPESVVTPDPEPEPVVTSDHEPAVAPLVVLLDPLPDVPALEPEGSADAVGCEEAAFDPPSAARACCDRNVSKKKDATASRANRADRRHASNNRGSSGKWYVLNPPLSSPKDPINR